MEFDVLAGHILILATVDRDRFEHATPVRLRGAEGGELSFFGMFATFDTSFDVTTSELAIEFVFRPIR